MFLVVPDESEFSRRVPLVIGTCTIGWIINVIRESEIDHLSMPWAMARVAQLLSCQKSTAILVLGSVETQAGGASGGPQDADVDELVTVRESVYLGPFQTEIIEGWVKLLLGDTAHVMITPLRVEGQPREGKPLPPGLHVLHAYMHLKNSSSKVSLVVRNVSDSHIFLKKGVPVGWVVSASLVPPAELSPEMEATLGAESRPEPMSVAVRQEKLLEKLNLDGLAHWSPGNAAAVRELALAYHDMFTLEGEGFLLFAPHSGGIGKLNLMYCVIYLDYVIVFGHMEEEHLKCREFNLKLKPSKCSFFQSEIMYLAHHVSRWGILPSQDNMRSVEEFPMPDLHTGLRVLWTSGALLEVYQGIHQHSVAPV